MKRFLVIFNRSSGTLLELRDMAGSANEAMTARLEAEERFRQDSAVEVVVLGANSRADLITTHARYFKNLDALARQVGAAI